jgi:hypothetical protein
VDAEYEHEWAADSWYGPGSVGISVDLNLKRTCIVPSNLIYESKKSYKDEYGS